MARSKHGTAMNDSSDQTKAQREAYSQRFRIGRNNRLGVKSDISNFAGSSPEDVMKDALKTFKEFSYTAGDNPDFYQDLDLTLFSAGNGKLDQAENQYDKPNKFGPNIKTIDIDNPAVAPSDHSIVSSPTFDSVGSAGFGISIGRNDPEADGINKPYLERRGTTIQDDKYNRGTGNKLGEYVNGPPTNDPYEYEE